MTLIHTALAKQPTTDEGRVLPLKLSVDTKIKRLAPAPTTDMPWHISTYCDR
ncbi:hypothetical protein MC7420_7130 [Coleofasciculus chthonoplastes PCC 7420]|uniref:Uncharacterized protein n=1 Tax=Coleofasciculus chthonoplastes PCC 7420 TaxID=118168 RepID=B4VHZ8_9CYAN|nr:hypothetical protein [Coleofasciculus chthonoplastes]EDX78477.1 hypothetical protein MC7420_7130 [Coleofasciculus chthonoplastes PCC 7420]